MKLATHCKSLVAIESYWFACSSVQGSPACLGCLLAHEAVKKHVKNMSHVKTWATPCALHTIQPPRWPWRSLDSQVDILQVMYALSIEAMQLKIRVINQIIRIQGDPISFRQAFRESWRDLCETKLGPWIFLGCEESMIGTISPSGIGILD